MSQPLADRVAVVTGGSRGLGKAIAGRFAEAGAKVAVLDLKQHWAQATVDEIVSKGGRGLALACDVADCAAVHAAIDEIDSTCGRLDILVNNAMWNRYEPIHAVLPATAERMIGVGFSAVVWTIQAAAPTMRRGGGGSILNIASVSAQLGLPNALLYCGIKAGVTGLTRSAAVELGPDRIRVNAISPSTVATEGVKEMLSQEAFEDRVAQTPLRRLGETDDIASAALFLASDASSFITGQVLTVDGGLANAFV